MHVNQLLAGPFLHESPPVGRPCTDAEPNKGAGLVLEVFSSSCRFSKAYKDLDRRVLPMDKNSKRAENFPVAAFDLTKP